MSQRAVWTSADIRGALNRAITLVRVVTVRQAWFQLGWRWLAAVAGVLVVDLLSPMPVWLRWVALLGLAAYPVAAALHIKRKIANREYAEEHAARMVEEGHPELDNALINAVQFERAIAASEAQAGLMRREISRAGDAISVTQVDDVVDRQGERRARTVLFAAIGAWLVAMVLLPGVVFTILPRVFAPWLDDITPPFSLTKIDLEPKGASVRFGGSLLVSVSLRGPIPENLTLGTRTNKGAWSAAPLESVEPGKYAITLNDLREDTWIVAQGGGARSSRYLVKVVLPPLAQSLQATYTYPAYTKKPANTEAVGEVGLHGLRNTKVRLEVAANRDVTGGELLVEVPDEPTQHFPLQVSEKNGRVAFANFPIVKNGTFRVALVSGESQVNSDAASGKIVIERDENPNVWFNEPAQEIVVTPQMKIALDLQADDDIGVNRVELHRVINGIADNASSMYEGAPVKEIGGRLVMDMADLGVRPGDEITYYANAYDNDPGHPNFAETEPHKIKVMSPEEYKQLLKEQRDAEKLSREISDIKDALDSLAERQQELAEKMEKLAQELKANPNDAKLKKEMTEAQAEQKKLQQEAKEMAQRLEDYAKSPSASKIEEALKKKVAEAAKNLAKAANEGMQKAQSSNPSEAAQGAKQATESLRKNAAQADKTVGEAVRNLEKAAALFQDVERFKDLLNRQGQLVLQAREFEQESPSTPEARAKMDALAVEQQRVQEELKQLQDDLRRHAADAQKDFPKASATAVRIADEIGQRQIANLMGSAQQGFNQEQGPDGFENAQKALEQMQAMMQKGGQCQSECKGELDLKLSQSLGQPKLGQSLSECMNPGQGQGNGPGMGIGSGGMQSGQASQSGMRMTSMNGPVAYTMNMKSLAGPSGSKRTKSKNTRIASETNLSSDQIEVLDKGEKHLPKASDSAGRGYPAEYRKLIKDYFISVTKENKTGEKRP